MMAMKVFVLLLVTCFTFTVEAQMKIDNKHFSFQCAETVYICSSSMTRFNVPNPPSATAYVTLDKAACDNFFNAMKNSQYKRKVFLSMYTCLNGKKADNYVVYKCKNPCYVCNWNKCKTPPPLSCPRGCGPKCLGGMGGDPHFRTYDGTSYSYHGQCDLVIARSPTFDSGLGLTVHARTEIVGSWSLISNAAVKIGEDVFELNHNASHYFNGVENASLPLLLAGKYSLTTGTVTQGNSSADIQTWYNIDLNNNQNIHITNFRTMISVKVDADMFDAAGMLGTNSKSGLVARDGETIIENFNEMGAEWQVTDVEPMLFQEARSPQYPEKCTLPTASVKDRRRLGAADGSMLRAKEVCAGVKDVAMRQFCVEDVLLTGDINIADQYGDLF